MERAKTEKEKKGQGWIPINYIGKHKLLLYMS